MSSVSVLDIVLYIEANDRNSILAESYSNYQLIMMVREAIRQNTIYFARYDDESELLGVVIGRPDYETKIMFISVIVTTHRSIMLLFIAKFLEEYKGWTLEGYRHIKQYKNWSLERVLKLYERLKKKEISYGQRT